MATWPLQGPARWAGSGQDSSQPALGSVGGEKDVSMEVDLGLQGAIEVILHEDLLVLAREGA